MIIKLKIKNMFENKVIRSIFGCREGKVTGVLKKLYNEDVHELYTSPVKC